MVGKYSFNQNLYFEVIFLIYIPRRGYYYWIKIEYSIIINLANRIFSIFWHYISKRLRRKISPLQQASSWH